MTITPRNSGWIELICGPMFSGKTEELIRRLVRAKIAKLDVEIFKPSIDTRYSEEHIVSHNKRIIKSMAVGSANDIYRYEGNAEVIGIDEAQFFDDEIVTVARRLANKGKRIIVAGLEKDYQGQPFGPMPQLMIEAEYITKVLAICVRCGNPANYSQRINGDADAGQVLIGESDKYEARCRNCFDPKIQPGRKK